EHEQLRPLGRATRGVKAMSLREGDELIGMDILPSSVIANLTPETEETEISEEETELTNAEETASSTANGLCVLAITMGGFGKRVPVSQFRLQNRAGMGLVAIKFRKQNDKLAALRVVNDDDELMIVTNRGIIIRQAVNAISMQSRMATGVRVQRLDEDDAIAAVALVPPTNGDEEESE
ncbi:MAG TPA: DNA gyrase subunit A, partial [Cyanobacteria bacterium UBA11367]|nr:DNA gyrase subunit A [Cyanobacteria bacterium UBA11367]